MTNPITTPPSAEELRDIFERLDAVMVEESPMHPFGCATWEEASRLAIDMAKEHMASATAIIAEKDRQLRAVKAWVDAGSPHYEELELVLALADRDARIAELERINKANEAVLAFAARSGTAIVRRALTAEAEVARLTECLAKANSQTEEYERRYYLEQSDLEDCRAEVARLREAMQVTRNDILATRTATANCDQSAPINIGRIQAYDLCLIAIDRALTKEPEQ